jgi:outer membrane protein
MLRSMRLGAAVLLAILAISKVDAAEPLPAAPPPAPPPAPIFFLHVGALGAFFETNATSTGGGFFNQLYAGGAQVGAIANATIRPNYTLGIEFGLFVTPNIALAISAGIPPLLHAKATGFTLAYAPAAPVNFGTNLLGSSRWGPAMLMVQYHFNNWGAIQPYVGVGPVYLLNFGNIADGILVNNFSIKQTWGFALQAGLNYMLTNNIGVFVDAKKVWLSTDVTGTVVGTPQLGLTIPVRTHVQLDPWVASTGLTLKF